MHTVFLAGGIASGKSTVARLLAERGARRIDLDDLARDVCAPGSETVRLIAATFGDDVIDGQTGELRRGVLASRAFASKKSTQALEAITHPAILALLECRLAEPTEAPVSVVEVPLLDRVIDDASLVDEVLCVTCPTDVRRARAISRGMDGADFDRRDERQPTQEYLTHHADTVFVNDGNPEELEAQVDAWWTRVVKGPVHGGVS